MKTIVELKKVSKEFGNEENKQIAVNNVDLTINEGEFVVILGQSGAGKSTVLNMIGGLDTPTSGNVIINGSDIANLSDKDITDYRAKKVGFIFQFYNLVPNLTVRENIQICRYIA